MFEINNHNTKGETFWLLMMDNKSSIILTYIKEKKVLDLRIFNDFTIYENSFKLKGKDIFYKGYLSIDGNEYHVDIITNKNKMMSLNFYYSLDSNLVISIIDSGKRIELTTLPNALLN